MTHANLICLFFVVFSSLGLGIQMREYGVNRMEFPTYQLLGYLFLITLAAWGAVP